MVYKVLWRNKLPIKPGTPGRTPFLFQKCTGLFYMRYTTHRTSEFTSHPKAKQWLSVFTQSINRRDSKRPSRRSPVSTSYSLTPHVAHFARPAKLLGPE